MSELQVFMCGAPKDHKCDDNGPELCGGTDAKGNSWQGPPNEENRCRANWGSVSCSVCGMTAMERSMWDGP